MLVFAQPLPHFASLNTGYSIPRAGNHGIRGRSIYWWHGL